MQSNTFTSAIWGVPQGFFLPSHAAFRALQSKSPKPALSPPGAPSSRIVIWVSSSSMRHWLIHWILKAVSLVVVAQILPGIRVDGFGSAFIAAAVIGLVSAVLGLFLKIILLPFIFLTLGIVYFLINGLMLKLASEIVPGFRVDGCMTVVVGSIL